MLAAVKGTRHLLAKKIEIEEEDDDEDEEEEEEEEEEEDQRSNSATRFGVRSRH